MQNIPQSLDEKEDGCVGIEAESLPDHGGHLCHGHVLRDNIPHLIDVGQRLILKYCKYIKCLILEFWSAKLVDNQQKIEKTNYIITNPSESLHNDRNLGGILHSETIRHLNSLTETFSFFVGLIRYISRGCGRLI